MVKDLFTLGIIWFVFIGFCFQFCFPNFASGFYVDLPAGVPALGLSNHRKHEVEGEYKL